MQLSAGVFAGRITGSQFVADRAYRIDAYGVRQRAYYHPWQEVLLVEAWKTTADGNWGFDENWNLRLSYLSGYRLWVPDGGEFFNDLSQALAYYLGVRLDWHGGEIEAEYQRRKQRWHSGWLGGSSKPVVFICAT